jgi:hypothetical protein
MPLYALLAATAAVAAPLLATVDASPASSAVADCPNTAPSTALVDIERRFAAEPEATDVHRWAVSAGRLQPERAEALLKDARARGALPLVRVRGRYDDRSNRKWTDPTLLPTRDHDSDFTMDLWLEWDLAELAAGPDLARAVREGRANAELRQAILAETTLVYFDRRRVLTEAALDVCAEPAARAERRLRRQELDATLDALTGGRWNQALAAAPQTHDPEDADHERVHRPGEDPDPGLRVPVHAADRPTDP